jgi:gliding motility-associated-like protein
MILLDPGIRDASFRWQDGSTAPTFNVTDPGLYKLTATNQCGDHSDSVSIVEGSCKVWLPNAFTPNNDGHNDIFRLKYPGLVKVVRLIIYDRSGQAVFESSDPYKGWDGRYRGIDAPTANYVWVMSYTDVYGYNGNAKGSVLLVR